MAAQILSGTQTPTGNYTLYTNNTSGNVRLIIHFLFVHGAINNATYNTRRVNITGGSHGTLQLPANLYFQTDASMVQRIRLGVGKDIAVEDVTIEAAGNNTVSQNGAVRTVVVDPNSSPFNTTPKLAGGPQVFPTEILMRPNQSMVFEAMSTTARQYISFNITVMPEGG
jgi:hypothetical protein